jgi:hypothetical protein
MRGDRRAEYGAKLDERVANGFNVYQDWLGKNILTSSLRESDSPEYAASFNPNALLEFTRWNFDRVLLICSSRTHIRKHDFGFRKEAVMSKGKHAEAADHYWAKKR